MRPLLLLLLLFAVHASSAQTISPGDKILTQLTIKPETYTMKLFMVRDTQERELGEALVTIQNREGKTLIIQEVKIGGMPGRWIDSTITESGTQKPVYHSSYNAQRDIVIRYAGDYVGGYYIENRSKTTTSISDTNRTKYFDSNFYPFLITALPLKEGYTAKFSIYDYASPQKHGPISASVDSVKRTNITIGGQTIPVFQVTTFDQISNGQTKHYIGVQDRRLYQVDSATPRGTMRMVRVKN